MNRTWQRLLLTLLLLLSSISAMADYPLEVIELKGRPADEIIPIIRPFVSPDGSIVGSNYQLIIRTSRENLQEIRTLLQRIDHPPRRLLISVRQGAAEVDRKSGVGLDARVSVGKQGTISTGRPLPEEGIRLRGLNAGTRSDLDVTHRVQALEGHPAFIGTGQSIPVTDSQFFAGGPFPAYGSSTRFRDISSGFYALPRLNGDRVTIEINPQLQRTGSVDDRIDFQRARTSVSGRLGEWIPVAGSDRSTAGDSSTIGTRLSTRDRAANSIYLKVDEIP